MKIILAPDSFKGTLDADRICAIEKEVILGICPHAQVLSIPMADGGEGITSSYLSIIGGEKVFVDVKDPIGGGRHTAYYGILPDGSAIMEMAQASGLPLAGHKKNPLLAETFGVGEMVLDAKKRGISKVLLGIGGSATNDCGIGMAAALGYKFYDANGKELPALAVNLEKIESIIPPERPLDLEINVACDVTNPLLGPRGATRTFGPQKGADPEMIETLEAGMSHYAGVLEDFCGKEVRSIPGSGAAGGLGAMLCAMLGARLLPGAEMLLSAAGFDLELKEADFVVTGEGRIDWQSAFGKVPGTISAHCARAGVPCIAICGSKGKDADSLLAGGKNQGSPHSAGLAAIYTTGDHRKSFEEIVLHAEEDLRAKGQQVFEQLLV